MSTTTIAPPATAAATAARAGSIRWSLARVEGRRLLLHPLFVFGMATSIAALLLYRSDAALGGSMLSGDCFVMVGGALWTYFAAFLATSRERRDAAQDFYAGQAVTPRLRTQAALLSTGAAGIAGVVLIGIATLVFAGFDGVVTIDPQRYPGQPLPPRSYTLQLIELAQGPAYLIAAGTLGVLAGTWTRQLLLAVLGALVLFLSPVALVPRLVYDDHASAGVYGAVQVAGPLGWHFASWHLLAIAAVAALAAAMALVRHDRGPRVALLALLGLGAAIAVVELGQRLPW